MTRPFVHVAILLVAVFILVPLALHADQAQYFYDALGRLVGVVDEQGNLAVYQYDKVGNLLSITRGTVSAPAITAVSPDAVDAGSAVTATISGSGLLIGTVRTSHPEMLVRTVSTADSTITATFTAPNPTTFGPTSVTITVPGGTTSTTITVRQPIPTITQITPTGGQVGTTVTVEGTGFGTKPGSNRVTFAGVGGARVTATVLSESSTRITAQVPVPVTPGPVTVEVGGLTSNGFQVFFDSVEPSVRSVVPPDGQTMVSLNTRISILFDEPINSATITNDTFFVGGPGTTRLAGTIDIASDQRSATFTPAQPLAANAMHSVTFGTGFGQVIRDVAGNALVNPGSTSFTTGNVVDTTAPTITSVSPASGAQNVPTNALVRIQFPETLLPLSVNTQTVTLSTGGVQVPVQLTLEQNHTVIRLQPANAGLLQANTAYAVTVTTGVNDMAGNPLAAPFASSFTTGAATDNTVPTVVSRTPADGATNVSLNTTIQVTFSEPIEPATVEANTTFTLNGGGVIGNIPGTFTFSPDRHTVTFTPAVPLFANQTFFVTLNGIEDSAGNRLAESTSSFTTEVGTGAVVPAFATVIAAPNSLFANGQTVTKIIISNIADIGGQLVPDGTQVAVTAAPTFEPASAGGTILGGTTNSADPRFTVFTTVGGRVTFRYQSPSLVLAPGTSASGIIQVASLSGGAPASLIGTRTVTLVTSQTAFLSSNPTALVPDGASTAEISVRVVDPILTLDGDRPVPPGTTIAVDAPDGGTINGGTVSPDPLFRLFSTKAGGRVQLTYTAPVRPAGSFALAAVRVFSVDQAGTPLGFLGDTLVRLGGSFPVPATGPLPTVLAVSPGDGQFDVGTNAAVVAKFSRSLNPATVTSSTFSVTNGVTPVAGTLTLSDSDPGPNTVVTLTPASPFLPFSSFTVTITTGVQDTSGNPLLASSFTTFSTIGGDDVTGPAFVQSSLGPGLTNVPHNAVINLLFNEPVNVTIISPSTVTVSAGGTPVPGLLTVGNFNNINNLLSFLPDQLLDVSTVYTINVSTAVKDASGNPLALAVSSSFTTAPAPQVLDLGQPGVANISPPEGQRQVPLDPKIIVQFDKAIDPLTVGPGSFGVSSFSTGEVSGALTASADQQTVTFTPAAPLSANTSHGVSVTNGARDVAGNRLDVSGVDSAFRTGSSMSDPTGPQVLAVSPANGATDVPLNVSVVIQFAEPVAIATVNAQTIVVSREGTLLSGIIMLEQDNKLVRWRPAPPNTLAPNANHTVTVTTGVRNLADTPLAAPVTSTFRTGSATDIAVPTITATSPPDGATNVSRTVVIQVTFSEPVNPATVLAGTTFFFESPQVNGTIPGTLTLAADRQALTYRPTFPLFANQTCTITGFDIEDVAGNKLPFSSAGFTTVVAPGTDLAGLPTSATVSATPTLLLPDGQSTATVMISSISREGVVVPDGTLIAVTAEPAYRLGSRGGVIQGGTVSTADGRFKLFPTAGGSVTLTYQSPNIPNLLEGNTARGIIQVSSVDAAGTPVSLIGERTITLGSSPPPE